MSEQSDTGARSARWVSLSRACEILGVDESTLRRWADSGRLRSYRTPGGHRRFSLANLEEIVAGENRHSGADEMERLVVPRIRRQLQRARQDQDGWYSQLSEGNRQSLKDLGRHLIEMAGEYMDRRTRRVGLLDQALDIGGEYGRILIEAGLPLSSAIAAYIGFRKTMDETTRQTALREEMPVEDALEAYAHVHGLGEQVLMGIAAAYGNALLAPEEARPD